MTITNWTNVTDLNGLLGVASSSTGGFTYVAITFMFFVVGLISMISFGVEVAVMASAFGAILLSLIFVSMGLMGYQWLGAFVGLELVMIIYAWWSSSKQ
jgi:hypothetical protein